MTKLATRWHAWRCYHDAHSWVRVHRAVWNGGYMRCEHCGRRTVQGGDAYGPAAAVWIAYGVAPPRDGLFFAAADWHEWNVSSRRAGRA